MTPSPPPESAASLEALFSEAPETVVLDNGLTLVFQQNPAHPVVSVQTWVKTGSIHEDAHLGSGLSHFLEHMLFKGTARRGSGEIAREVQSYGGQINAYTAFDRTVYYIDSPAECLEQSLDILCDMAFFSSLPPGEVEKEKGVILREIDMTLDDPDRILSRSLFATAFRQHPFRFPVIGLRPLFERVDRSILERYYLERYQPNNVVLSVVGDFEEDALIEAVSRTFGEIPRGPNRPVVVPEEPEQLAVRESRLSGDYQTVRGMMGFKIPSMRHPDAPGLDIIGAIIGSGHSGRLRQKLREDMGLVHSVSASAWNPGNPGLFFASFRCDPDKARKAEEALRSTFEVYAETGFTEAELDKARRFAFVSEVHSRQTTSGLAAKLGLITALVGDLQYPKRYFEKLQNLTTESLKALAARTFKPDQLTVATLLPKSVEARVRPSRKPESLPPFEGKTLPNGARLYWQRDARLPHMSMRFAGLGGPLYEDPSHRGATSLLATLLARDTRFQTAHQVAQSLEGNGGFLLDSSGNNTFALSLELGPDMCDLGLRTLHDAVRYPAFKPSTLIREREAQLAHLRTMEEEILDRGRLSLRKRFFGTHPFASDPCGSLDTVPHLDEAYLKCLYKRLVVAPNSVLVVTGDFDPDTFLPKVEAFLMQLPDYAFRRRNMPFSGPAITGHEREVFEREQAVVFDAFPDVGFQHESELAGELLDELLSDMSGALFRSVREDQSLAYFVGSSRLLGYNQGAFSLYAGTHPTTTQAVYDCFDAELERIRDGNVTPDEIAAARTRLKVENRFSLQKPATRAGRVALNALYGRPIMDWLDYEERLDAVTPDRLRDFASTHLVPEKRLRFTIGPEID